MSAQLRETSEPVPWWDYLEGQLYFREAKVLIDGEPPAKDPRQYVLRARAGASLRWHEKAIAEYDAAMKLIPQDTQVALEAQRNRATYSGRKVTRRSQNLNDRARFCCRVGRVSEAHHSPSGAKNA